MRLFLCFLAGLVLVAGCAPRPVVRDLPSPPVTVLSVSPHAALKDSLDAAFPDSLFPPSAVGAKVIALPSGELLYSLNERMLFNPASNQKLFTSAAALLTLGPAYEFATTVHLDTGHSLIVVKGHGDPVFSRGDLDSLARAVLPHVDVSRRWRLAVDVSLFDDLYWGEGWTWDEEPAPYGMFITPLTLDNNAITVRTLPGEQAGDSVRVWTEPATSYVRIDNSARTEPDTVRSRLRFSRKWRDRSNTLTVEGGIAARSRQQSGRVSIWRPELYAGTVFAERLREGGVYVDTVVVDTLRSDTREIGRFVHTLDTVITFMNKESDNLSAEVVLKVLAAATTGSPGTARGGLEVVARILAQCGVDTNSIALADGSGLSRYNLTSPSVIVRLLDTLARNPDNFLSFLHSLPIAGIDGTLERRMQGTTAQNNLRAKTGTLSGVTALSGYVRGADGALMAFSILMQNHAGSGRDYRLTQDRICTILSRFRRN
jgi:D-alanyl-D-alanine carboxypeptidase/D-alanyl-D-alanine-endopeptidase (penicillin-binding protein 4)